MYKYVHDAHIDVQMGTHTNGYVLYIDIQYYSYRYTGKRYIHKYIYIYIYIYTYMYMCTCVILCIYQTLHTYIRHMNIILYIYLVQQQMLGFCIVLFAGVFYSVIGVRA